MEQAANMLIDVEKLQRLKATAGKTINFAKISEILELHFAFSKEEIDIDMTARYLDHDDYAHRFFATPELDFKINWNTINSIVELRTLA